MPSKEHEILLVTAINELEKQGFKVIRLDKRIIPDAIAIDFKNRKIIAVEAVTHNALKHCAMRRFLNDSLISNKYDEGIIIFKPKIFKRRRFFPQSLVDEARRLRKEEGLTIKEIQRRLNIKGYATVWRWLRTE